MADMRNLGEILQRAGAGFQGNLAQFDASRAQQQMMTEDREERRAAKAKVLSMERATAAAQDAQVALQFLEAGATDKALELVDNRLGFIKQFEGDPTDTQAVRDLIAKGDIDTAKSELKLFTTEAEARGLIKPMARPEAQSAPGKMAVDAGLKPGTPEFAAYVLQQMAPKAEQPRMIEQNGIQYWAEGPNAGKPVVPGAAGAAAQSPIEQFTKRFGAVPANMTPEVRDGAITGRLVPMQGGEKDPAVIEQAKAAKLKEDLPTARSKFLAVTQPLQAMKAQIAEIKKDPNTVDVVGVYEGGTNDEKWRLNPFTAQGNSTAASRIENLRNVAQSIGLNLTRQGGVAPGSITEREWPKFEAFVANLDTKQGEKAFFKQLTQAEMMATDLITGMEEEFKRVYGESPLRRKEDAPKSGPQYLKALLDKYPARK
jgi:hypothetical protein